MLARLFLGSPRPVSWLELSRAITWLEVVCRGSSASMASSSRELPAGPATLAVGISTVAAGAGSSRAGAAVMATAAEQLSTVSGVRLSPLPVQLRATESPIPSGRVSPLSTHSQSPERRMPVGLAPQLSSRTLPLASRSLSWHREMRVLPWALSSGVCRPSSTGASDEIQRSKAALVPRKARRIGDQEQDGGQ